MRGTKGYRVKNLHENETVITRANDIRTYTIILN
jgi:hypothetical protein